MKTPTPEPALIKMSVFITRETREALRLAAAKAGFRNNGSAYVSNLIDEALKPARKKTAA